MIPLFVEAGLIIFTLAFILVKRPTRSTLSKIPGPKASSFFLGSLGELIQRPAGQTEVEWQRLYGDVVRFKSFLGGDQLLITDPKALQRIYNTSAYQYPKPPVQIVFARFTNGRGVTAAEGDVHKRHRRILLPGFGGPESKAFLGIFRESAQSMCGKWSEIIDNSTTQKVELNTSAWLSRATLDAIGLAAFNVHFDTINDNAHPLAKAYKNSLNDIFGHPSLRVIFAHEAFNYLPTWIVERMLDRGSNPRLQRAREVAKVATEVAKELVHEKVKMPLAGKGSRDVFSLLVKANMDAEAKDKLTDEELYAQMRTILFAGHDTTANTLNWLLLELARHPEIQSRLRAEIRDMETCIQARGDIQFTAADIDGMPYLTAVIKEVLRYHPAVVRSFRIAASDDTLPLSQPIITVSGEVINEVIVPKGTQIVASIAAYNRDKELWGEDAHKFNPDRWLDGVASEKKSTSIGVYANLMTFLSGSRSCLGWRFAVIEVQAFIIEIIGKFEVAMTERSEKVRPGTTSLLTPVIEGETELGAQLPLGVSIAARSDST